MQYIQPEELVIEIESNSRYFDPDQTDIKIIDVRNMYEFNSGHIKGALNLNSELWESDTFVDNVIKSHSSIKKIIIHCQLSQSRGPSCATKLIYQLKKNEDIVDKPKM
jgi:rhodanese-related sulfurtransferase